MYVLINFVCMKTDEIKTEIHPLEPFFPQGARLLMMGSFPPKRERWKMDFYYPNFQNDMWRIFGLVFFDDKEHFLTADKKSFCEQRIRDFLIRQGIALTDSGREVVRQKDNASDKFFGNRPQDRFVRRIAAITALCSHCDNRAESDGHFAFSGRSLSATGRRFFDFSFRG